MQPLTPNQSAALNLEKSISLTANAGSGKTLVLVKRYLEIALNNDISLHRIAAITFTEKAAGELYKKVVEEIDRLTGESKEPHFNKKLNSIRRQLVSAKISTIHSFCLDILRDFPVEAELDAKFIPIDEILSSELIERSTEEVINESLRASASETIKILIRLFGSKFTLAREINKMISNRKNVLTLSVNLYSKDVQEVARFFHDSFFEIAEEIFSKYKFEIQTNLETINNAVLQVDPENGIAIDVFELLSKLKSKKNVIEFLPLIEKIKNLLRTDSGSLKIRGYLGQKIIEKVPKENINNLEKFFDDFDALSVEENPGVELELARYGKLLINVFNSSLERYVQIKKENGYLDFEDILLKTKNILLVNEVKNQLVDKYNYLLVDEYQDTSEIQYQIFLPIVDHLKRSNLFVVGDEKQSIYKFRDAELEVFGQTKRAIRDAEGIDSIMTLPDSFRMSPAICLFTNILFQNLFKNPSDLFNEVEHSDIICATSNSFEGKIEFLLSINESAEAELVANRILNLMNENYGQITHWNQIAVLVRKRASFNELEKTFTKFKIPFTIVGGKGFFQRQNIYDIHNYFSFLLDLQNDAALIGILRSPFFNVSDSKIFELSFNPGKNYFEKISDASKSDDYWKKIFDKLKENLYHSKRMELQVLLRKILEESGLISVISSKSDRKQELGNIEKLIKMTIDFSNEGFKSLYDFVHHLGEAIEKYEDVSQATLEKEKEGVNILTIHQAKGLEFDAVFLYNCNDTSQRSMIKAREISVNKKFGLLTKVPLNQNYFSEYKTAPIVSICNLIEDKKDFAELKRLLYVAVTRAKSFLFISSSEPEKDYKQRSFMKLIESGLASDLTSEGIKLHGTLTYLRHEDEKFINYKKDLQINIPVIRELKNDTKDFEVVLDKTSVKKINLHRITDSQHGEIVSASRLSAHSNCPVKYNLAYKLGLPGISFSEANNKFKSNNILHDNVEELNSSELNINSEIAGNNYSFLKGRIIHTILEMNVDKKQISEFVKREIEILSQGEMKYARELEKEINAELGIFYESDEFKYLSSFQYHRNESEIYVYENDYLLYGIIDKLIFDRNKLIIVDFKTDNVDKNDTAEKVMLYKNQLLFYLYIASTKFSKYSEYEGRLVFIKKPDLSFIVKWDKGIKESIQRKIKDFVSDNRKDNFIPNHLHCPECIYSVQKKICILEKVELIN